VGKQNSAGPTSCQATLLSEGSEAPVCMFLSMELSLRSVDALLQHVGPCIPSTRADVGRLPSAHTRPGHVEVAFSLAFHLFAYLLRQVELSSAAAPVCAGKVCQTGLEARFDHVVVVCEGTCDSTSIPHSCLLY